MSLTEQLLVNHEDDGDVENHLDNENSSRASQNNNVQQKQHLSFVAEFKLFISIAIPTIAFQSCVFFSSSLSASYIGRNLGTTELASYSLASLTGNFMCLSVILGSLTAYETLGPRAYNNRRYEEVGRLAVRGFMLTSLLLLPVMIPLVPFFKPLLIAMGQDVTVASMAAKWIRIYVVGAPFVLLCRTLMRFLGVQNIVAPMVYGSFVGNILAAPFLIRIFVDKFGFLGSAMALVVSQIFTLLFSLLYVQYGKPHHPRTWPGLSTLWKDSVKLEPMLNFLKLSTGGITMYMEWWFWEATCFVAGKLGVLPLSIHSVAYQLIPLLYMIPSGANMGMTIRLGALLSTNNVSGAKKLAGAVLLFVTGLATLVVLILVYFRDEIIGMFTKEDKVIEGSRIIWPYFCAHVVMTFYYCINSGILKGLGKQRLCGGIVVLNLWIVTLPTMIYVAVVRNGGLYVMWKILPASYAVLNVCLVLAHTVFSDWNEVAKQILDQNNSGCQEHAEEPFVVDSKKNEASTDEYSTDVSSSR